MRALLHYLAVAAGLGKPSTQVTSEELAVLVRHAADARVIVEVGTFEGRTAAALAAATMGEVFSVDVFRPGRLGVCYGERIARLVRRRRRLANLHFVKGRAHDVAATFDRSVDFVFVDADHSYEAARQDWLDWTAKLRHGGIIAMHDSRIAPSSPVPMGSMRFVEEARRFAGFQELPGVGSLSVFRKS